MPTVRDAYTNANVLHSSFFSQRACLPLPFVFAEQSVTKIGSRGSATSRTIALAYTKSFFVMWPLQC